MKEKRKGRLDKVGGGNVSSGAATEFIGFGAFSSSSPTDSAAATAQSAATTPTSAAAHNNNNKLNSNNNSNHSSWSPVFTGPNKTLQLLFARLAQKKDVVTKTKALQELADLIQSNQKNDDNNNPDNVVIIDKHEIRVHALPHYTWLYAHKLVYSRSPEVRATALIVWRAFWDRVPKATATVRLLVWGMWYAAQSDPPVRQQAQRLRQQVVDWKQSDSTPDKPMAPPPWSRGLLTFARRILSYSRPSVLYEALLARKSSNVSRKDPTMDDKAKEDADELFQTLTGLVLDALCQLCQDTDLNATLVEDLETVSASDDVTTDLTPHDLLFKCLNSPVEGLRVRTYRLVSIVASSSHGALLLSPATLTTLLQALFSEKNPNAWPVLLEAFLAVAAHTRPFPPPQQWRKGLIKALKKACYGASVASWGPILLPLVTTLSSLPTTKVIKTDNNTSSATHSQTNSQDSSEDAQLEQQQQVQQRQAQLVLALELIQAAWEGQHVTLGMTEAGRLALAVAETAHYTLLKPIAASEGSETTSLAIAKIWLEVLENALTDQSLATGNARKAAWEPLLHSLAQQLQRYQDQSVELLREPSKSSANAFGRISSDFWSQVSWPCTHPDALTYFVAHLKKRPPVHPMSRVAQTCFLKLLAPYQESSMDLPTLDVYRTIQALVDYHPRGVVTERFVLNDLLQWSILHTTSQQQQRRRLSRRSSSNNETQHGGEGEDEQDFVQADFGLLASALGAVSDGPTWWSTVLKEIIAAQPNLHALTVGIQVILDSSDSAHQWVSCGVLNGFAQNIFAVGTTYSASEQLEFCRTVLGLTTLQLNGVPRPIVQQSVWERWIQAYQNMSHSTTLPSSQALSQILLQLTQVPNASKLLDSAKVESIILQSWLHEHVHQAPHGSEGFSDEMKTLHHYTDVLDSNPDMAAKVVHQASLELKRQVESQQVDIEDPHAVANWGLRSWRLVEMCQHVQPVRKPSFSLLGLDQAETWNKNPLFMFALVMALFDRISDTSARFRLLQSSECSQGLFQTILVAMCEASEDLTLAAKVGHGDDNSFMFLESLGLSSQFDFLESFLRDLISQIAEDLKDPSLATSTVPKLNTILSSLIRATFPLLPVPYQPRPVPTDIRTGDKLYYISDPKSPLDMEPANVVKAHYDAEAGYYFTIHVIRDGIESERQTVVDRLRVQRENASETNDPKSNEITENRRALVRELVLSTLFIPHFGPSAASSGLYEVFNTVMARIGVGKDRGIGSSHFEMFKMLSEENKTCQALLNEKNFARARESLWKLALSFGLGRNSEARSGTFIVFAVDPLLSLETIASLYNEQNFEETADLDYAVMAWISVSLSGITPDEANMESLSRILSVAFSRIKIALAEESSRGFNSGTMLALTALYFCRRIVLNCPGLLENNPQLETIEIDCFAAMIAAFSSSWGTDDSSPLWKKYSDFPRLVEDSYRSKSGRRLLGEAISPDVVEHLVNALFSESSRFDAFNLLDCALTRGKVLRGDQDIVLGESTSRHLEEWKEGMDVDGATELHEDVEVVSQWLPLSMMTEIETWQHETFEDLNELKTIGRLLSWLAVLRVIESAAPEDFRSRPAFVSYLTKSHAASTVLNVSILFDSTVNSTGSIQASHVLDTDTILENEEMIEISNLASHVIFRTFETLPSLCRRWWEEECPKVYTSRVQLVVEQQIAPEILTRELRRMKEATKHFGEMDVSGSVMTREVTASYVQDDFTLTALIRLPSSFPLRSAEVDCSRTLGVPAKRWKRWSLQITQMLNSQGGTLQDALALWKDNVDQEFDGIEPCPVCYSVLHSKTHKLPTYECATCHNRFHFDCLTQWFKQSGKNQCVLCQQEWRGIRV